MSATLCAVFFVSGVAALVFETLWFHQAGLTLGNSIWASSLVLAAFMGGLATGNALAAWLGDRIRRPIRSYAVLEVVIAVTGIAVVIGLPLLTPALSPVLEQLQGRPWALNAIRSGTAFGLLLIPSAAMGATLPLLTRALYQGDPRFGPVLGRLYGWNTLGAVVGALLGDALLIESLGIRGTAMAAAAANGAAAVAAIAIARRPAPAEAAAPAAASGGSLDARAVATLAAAFLSGALLLALEVVWFRFLLLTVSGTALAFAVMLSIVLAGIGVGGLVGARWLVSRPDAFRFAPLVALAAGFTGIVSYALFDAMPRSFGYRSAISALETLEVALPLMLPTALLSGVVFTLLGEVLHRRVGAPMRSAGLLTLANTLGAMAGSLLGGFVLLPRLGVEASLLGLAASYGLAACLAYAAIGSLAETRRGHKWLAAAAAAFALALALFPRGAMEERHLSRAARRFVEWETVLVREALTETLTYLRRDLFGAPYAWRLLTNGHSMSSTARRDQRYMTLFVSLPAAFHEDLRDALLISYGVGVTASALVERPELETIDIVDISADILETNRIIYPEPGSYPPDDPRVRVHIEDGRHFLQTTSRRFDLITGEPPPPKLAGIVNLYTREYFELVHARLAPGGIASYWLPTKGLFPEDAQAITAAFCAAFADCSLWSGSAWDWILIGSRGGIPPATAERLERPWQGEPAGRRLRALGVERPEQLGALFLADHDQLQEWTAGTPPLADDYPKRLRNDLPSPQPFFREFMAPEATRSRFLASDALRELLPGPLYEQALAALPAQALLEAALFQELGSGAELLRELHPVLTDSELVTLPQWMLRSDAGAIAAARASEQAGRAGAAVTWHLAVEALSKRRYAEAAAGFERTRKAQAASASRDALYYEIYARCLAGDLETARRLADGVGITRSQRPADREFEAVLREHFDWGP